MPAVADTKKSSGGGVFSSNHWQWHRQLISKWTRKNTIKTQKKPVTKQMALS